jgi:dCMP deaminase
VTLPHSYFFNLARHVATASKDRSTKVGCVLVVADSIASTGCNGFPRGIDDDAPERHERPEKYFWAEHAERNAIYNAARIGTPLKGCRAYVTMFPCMDCARGLIQIGCRQIIAPAPNAERWSEHFNRTEVLCREAGVDVVLV